MTIVQLVGGGIMGFLLAVYTKIPRRRHQKISYQATSIRLLNLHEKTPKGIKITADKSLITGDKNDSLEQVQIESAYVHAINFKNKGNEVAENLVFKIIFEKPAKIISHTTSQSSFSNRDIKVTFPSGSPNVVRYI